MISRFELYIQILNDANRRYVIIVILIEIKVVRIRSPNTIKHNTDYIYLCSVIKKKTMVLNIKL